ncbi:MAG: hypothetical protein MNPFHGCM_00272 [Gemmatimonadaceae bacterium]|nr:hypothetical protein [Gemmatimonadaceae bacterium]
MSRIARILTLLCLVRAPITQAQLVRGTVTEGNTGAPLSGVLVALVDDSARTVASALTSDRGLYGVRAPSAGRYRIEAKRIGVRRYTSAMFDLATGESRELNVQLDALLYTLPEVVVTALPLCKRDDRDGARVAALWDEARTALAATQISLRDRLFSARLVRYVRQIDPATLKVIDETRSDVQGVVDRPFFSLPAESLSAHGFWRKDQDGSTLYFAPDAAVLLSDRFQADHCFGYARPSRDRKGMVGLQFEPAKRRDVGDVRGTLWLDARTFELRFVEYQYTNLDDFADNLRLGGEVHFARLRSGAWIVRRWFIRMPQVGRSVSPPVGLTSTAPSVLVRSVVYRLREEGGDVTAEGLRVYEKPAMLIGEVLDSLRRPLAGARVRLDGTPYSGVTGASGTFALDSLPAGNFDVVVEHADYDAIGLKAASADAVLAEGETVRLNLRASNTREIVSRLCPTRPPARDRGTLHVSVRNAATEGPLAFADLAVTWLEVSGSGANLLSTTRQQDGTSDSRGGISFCGLPSRTLLTLNRRLGSDRLTPMDTLRLNQGEIARRVARVPAPRP